VILWMPMSSCMQKTNRSSHAMAREWGMLSCLGASPVCLCWTVLVRHRIGTIRASLSTPCLSDQALSRVQSWLDQPCTRIILHRPALDHLQKMLVEGQAVAKPCDRRHLAALL